MAVTFIFARLHGAADLMQERLEPLKDAYFCEIEFAAQAAPTSPHHNQILASFAPLASLR